MKKKMINSKYGEKILLRFRQTAKPAMAIRTRNSAKIKGKIKVNWSKSGG